MLNLQRSRGFSVIELMVAVTVLALLLFGMMPAFADWIRAAKVRTTAESFQAGLQRARIEAVRRNRPVSFYVVDAPAGVLDATCTISGGGLAWVVSFDNPGGQCGAAPSSEAAPRIVEAHAGVKPGEGVTVAARDAGGGAANRVAFGPTGEILDAAGAIRTLDLSSDRAGARRLRLQISASGGVRMCDLDVSDPGDPRSCP